MTFSRPHLATHLLLPALLCLGMIGNAVAEDHEHEHAQRHEGKHVHGVAELNIAQQGTQLYLELHSPAMNIVGYEHAPASDLDQEALDKAVATLKQGARLFVFNKQAACRAVEVELNSALIGSAEPTAKHEAHEAHHGHADFDADYLFHCDAPEQLESIDVRLFKAFPGTHALHVQYIVGNRQGAAELNAQQQGLSFQH